MAPTSTYVEGHGLLVWGGKAWGRCGEVRIHALPFRGRVCGWALPAHCGRQALPTGVGCRVQRQACTKQLSCRLLASPLTAPALTDSSLNCSFLCLRVP